MQTETIVDQAPYADTIPIPGTLEAENYDVGGQGESYSDNETANQGGAYRTDGVDIVSITGGGYAVGYTVAGEWLEYTVNVADPGIYTYTARIAAGGDSSSFRLFLDDVAISDTVKVSSTGSDWETYAELSGTTVSLSAGAHVLKIEITGSYVNIDNFVFTKGTTHISKSTPNLMGNSQTYKVYNANGSYIGSFNAVDIPAIKTEIRKSNWKSGIYLVKNKNTSAFIGIEK